MRGKPPVRPAKNCYRFIEILEECFQGITSDEIEEKKKDFFGKLELLELSKPEILANLIYYFNEVFHNARLKTTDSPIHTSRDFALQLYTKLFPDRVNCEEAISAGVYIRKEDLLLFLAGVTDSPNSTFHLAKNLRLFSKENDPVLITGETGTGKEALAKVVHYLSNRAKEKFVPVNCGGIPESLLESTLFGHVKGAFTGASGDRLGLLEGVGTGTLFLDEIGDMPLPMQVKMLRVLQSGDYYKVGDTKKIKNFKGRIIAATNKNLKEEIKASDSKFRPDLYYRLNVFPITLRPFRELPERERSAAILHKLRHIIYAKSKEPGDQTIFDHLTNDGPEEQVCYDNDGYEIYSIQPENDYISDAAVQLLLNYDFPGNYRELHNIMTRAYILSEKRKIEVSALPDEVINFKKSEAVHEGINRNEVEKKFLKDIVDYAENIKKDIVCRKLKSIYSTGQNLKTVLRNEGVGSRYQNIRKKIIGIIGKEEMAHIIKGN